MCPALGESGIRLPAKGAAGGQRVPGGKTMGGYDSVPVHLRGTITSARSGKAAPRMPIAAARLTTLQAADPTAPAPAELLTISQADGTFDFEIDPSTPGLDRVVVFTTSPLYRCAAFGARALGPGVPSVADLLKSEPEAVDVRRDATIELVAEPVVEHEPLTEMVPMTDGVRLATEIFLPDGEGPWPAVLVRTPYGRFNYHDHAAVLCSNGYACVVQDSRGRFDSEGEGLAFVGDGWSGPRDGYDTVEWIARQPWCNGKVATVGGSAMGITQYLLAVTAPPHLVCQVIVVGAPSLYHHAVYPGGLYRKEQVDEWLRANGFPEENAQLIREHYMLDEWQDQFDATTPHRVASITVPALHIGGWFDTFQQGTLDGFTLRQHAGGDGARGNQRLIMGPWPHGIGGRQAGELTWPENAVMDLWAETLRFLDFWMRGEDDGITSEPPVRYYVMGSTADVTAAGNVWRFADDWPPPSEPVPAYLHAGGKLLAEPPHVDEGRAIIQHDPYDPVPSAGGFNLSIASGPWDQSKVEQRTDVLVWTSPPLSEPLEVVGRVRAHLWLSSNCFDADIIVKLCDVYPDGRSILVTYGGLRLRFRNGFDHEELLDLGQVYEVEIDMWSTAYAFNTGHRVRIDIQSSDFPHFDVNPGTGEPVHQHTFALPAQNIIYLSDRCPSHVVLPVTAGHLPG